MRKRLKTSFLMNKKLVFSIGSSEIGGAQKVFLDIISEVKNQKLDFIILLPEGPLINYLKEKNYNYVIISYSSFKSWYQIYNILKDEQIFIVNTHLTNSSLLFSLINLFHRRLICASFHNQIVHEKLNSVQKFFYPYLYFILSKLLDGIIVNSKYNKKHFIEIANIRSNIIKVIPNGINESLFSVKESLVKERSKKYRIGYFGRLSSEKGIQCLLDSILYIKQYNIECIILGDGPLRKDLDDFVKKNQLSEKVSILGFKQDVVIYMQTVDLVVVPSINEAFGITILEAFALGKIVIASNVGAIPELVIDNYTGFLFPVNDSKILSNKILFAMENSGYCKEIANNAYQFYRGNYTVESMCNSIFLYFDNLYQKKIKN